MFYVRHGGPSGSDPETAGNAASDVAISGDWKINRPKISWRGWLAGHWSNKQCSASQLDLINQAGVGRCNRLRRENVRQNNSPSPPERGKGRGEEPKQRGIDAAPFPAHTRRMAKKSEVKSATEPPRRRVGKQTADAGSQKSGSLCAAVPLRLKSSSLLDTRVVYCGDNLEPLGPCRTGQRWGETKEKRACNSAFRTPHSAIALAGSFYYHCDWHASHYVKMNTPPYRSIFNVIKVGSSLFSVELELGQAELASGEVKHGDEMGRGTVAARFAFGGAEDTI